MHRRDLDAHQRRILRDPPLLLGDHQVEAGPGAVQEQEAAVDSTGRDRDRLAAEGEAAAGHRRAVLVVRRAGGAGDLRGHNALIVIELMEAGVALGDHTMGRVVRAAAAAERDHVLQVQARRELRELQHRDGVRHARAIA